jgi:phosphopantothenoylcysteine decarboxylase/phosphopantothenate--cysteine ligase
MTFDGRRVLVGLSGGIACYKACDVVRQLRQAGAIVPGRDDPQRARVRHADDAPDAVGQPRRLETFDLTDESEIGHIRLADTGRRRRDRARDRERHREDGARDRRRPPDDGAARDARAARRRAAMNVNMWEHVATQANVRTLAERGARIVGPASGSLACGYEGAGRLAEPAEIVEAVATALDAAGPRRASASSCPPGRRARRSIRCGT